MGTSFSLVFEDLLKASSAACWMGFCPASCRTQTWRFLPPPLPPAGPDVPQALRRGPARPAIPATPAAERKVRRESGVSPIGPPCMGCGNDGRCDSVSLLFRKHVDKPVAAVP